MFENINTETEIVVVLDRSGSMSSIVEGTLKGFNTFLKEQQGAAGEAFMTLVQFDDRYQIDYKSVNAKHVAPLNTETYVPRGYTALYDAIGKTINELSTNRDVVFVIITDGLENASTEFDSGTIKQLIESKQLKDKWKFLFLGANQDAVLTGDELGIARGQSMSYRADDARVGSAFMSVARNASAYRSSKEKGFIDDDCFLFSSEQRDDAMSNE